MFYGYSFVLHHDEERPPAERWRAVAFADHLEAPVSARGATERDAMIAAFDLLPVYPTAR